MSFESRLERVLKNEIPQRYLANVPVFRPDKVIQIDAMASEIDFLLHIQSGDNHKVIIVEAKGCPILGSNDQQLDADSHESEWLCVYPDSENKSVKRQVRNQANALKLNLEPLAEGNRLKFYGLIVTDCPELRDIRLTDTRSPDLQLSLLHVDDFKKVIRKFVRSGDILRVQESDILRRLRFGQAVPELGHPEIPHAINYSLRCRAFLDSELFQHFKPKGRHWAINGSAGMGKSVLLAYSLVVLTTDRFIDALGDKTRYLNDYTPEAEKLGLPRIDKRRIWAVALSEKQRQSLQRAYNEFEKLYQEIDPYNHYRRISPTIQLWSSIDSMDECNVLLIDESHDLNDEAQRKIHEWYSKDKNRFLFLACDRHQKLRLIRKDARILNGFDFSRQTTKLDRNYRNPFPVHCASMALLFRWFGPQGPKVVPSKDELEAGLGFSVDGDTRSDKIVLKSRNDAHPANNWSHLVSMYTGPRELEAQLRETALSKDDVLWARFNVEVPEFGYEKLTRYTYHNLYSNDTSEVIDKYIKGQEFPIVVIEGLPDNFEAVAAAPEGSERRMWVARRQLYLVASRATCFLFFVRSGNESEECLAELREMTGQLSTPDLDAKLSGASGKMWTVNFNRGDPTRSVPDYIKLLGEMQNTEGETVGGARTVEIDQNESRVSAFDRPNADAKKEAPPVSDAVDKAGTDRSHGPVAKATETVEKTTASTEHENSEWTKWVGDSDLSRALIILLNLGLKRLPSNSAELYVAERLFRKEKPSNKAFAKCDRSFLENFEAVLFPIFNGKPGTPIELTRHLVSIKKRPPTQRLERDPLPKKANQKLPEVPRERPVCLLSRPVTPASISETLSVSRQQIANSMANLGISAMQNTNLKDDEVGQIVKSLGYKAFITGKAFRRE